MDEEKKSEAGWNEPERVGSYRLEAPVSQSRDGRQGLYLATNETSGALALVLVLKTSFHKGVGALKELRVRFISSASEGYRALEALARQHHVPRGPRVRPAAAAPALQRSEETALHPAGRGRTHRRLLGAS